MSPGWEDLVARVRGASGHLLGRERLLEVARSRDLVRLVATLEEEYGASLGIEPGSSPAQAELAVRRVAAAHLATLARWSLQRSKLLTPFFLDEDRRSVRALLRGAAAGSPEAERLAGLVPTPTLPERALRELALQRTVGEIAALLSAWGHPFGSRLLAATRAPTADLLRLDLILNEVYIAESTAAVRRSPRGHDTRRELREFVSDTADIENATTALQLAGQRITIAPETLFLPGGRRLSQETFLEVVKSAGATTGRVVLERAFRGTPLAHAFAGRAENMEDAILAVRLRQAIRNALHFPLGAAPVIAFLLRLRAEIRDLCLIIWRQAAGATPPTERELLTLT